MDALSVSFRDTTVTTVKLAEGIVGDYDAAGRLVRLEIMDAGTRFGDSSTLREVVLEGVGLAAPRVSEQAGTQ